MIRFTNMLASVALKASLMPITENARPLPPLQFDAHNQSRCHYSSVADHRAERFT